MCVFVCGEKGLGLVLLFLSYQTVDEELSRPTNGFQWLPCVFGINVIDLSLQLQDLFSLDGDVCGLTLDTAVTWSPLHASQLSEFSRFCNDALFPIRVRPPYPGSS